MQKRVRCPLCGMLVWSSQINKSHSIDVKHMTRYVRDTGSGGFRYTDSEDVGLVALVRAKIKMLYEKYFMPDITVAFIPSIRSRGGVRVRGGTLLRPGISTVPVVRDL